MVVSANFIVFKRISVGTKSTTLKKVGECSTYGRKVGIDILSRSYATFSTFASLWTKWCGIVLLQVHHIVLNHIELKHETESTRNIASHFPQEHLLISPSGRSTHGVPAYALGGLKEGRIAIVEKVFFASTRP